MVFISFQHDPELYQMQRYNVQLVFGNHMYFVSGRAQISFIIENNLE